MCVHDIHLLAANKQMHRSACLVICSIPGQCLTIYVCTLWSLCFTITLENLDPFTQFFHHNILREAFYVQVLLFHMCRYTALWNFKIQKCHLSSTYELLPCYSWISKISVANTKWFSQLFHLNSVLTKYKQAVQSGLETLPDILELLRKILGRFLILGKS